MVRVFSPIETGDYYPKDTGCSVAPKCLECPLPMCRYEMPGAGLRSYLNAARNRQIIQLLAAGADIDDLAGRFNVSRRAIYRARNGR